MVCYLFLLKTAKKYITKSKPRLKCTMCIINLDTRSFEDSRIQRKTDSFQHGFFSFAEKFKSTLVTSLADAR